MIPCSNFLCAHTVYEEEALLVQKDLAGWIHIVPSRLLLISLLGTDTRTYVYTYMLT